ncbi:hypothetical protein J6K35_02725 [bacterium]|nr:hypothetical protein [bacterium]
MFSKNNTIILHKKDGSIKKVKHIRGLHISCKGKNNCIEIWEPCNFVHKFFKRTSVIKILGDSNHIIIKGTEHSINTIKIKGVKNNNKIIIGENLYQTGQLLVEFAHQSNLELTVGNNCMFGQNVNIMLADFHKILDLNSGEQTNQAKYGINIGNHVWLARNVNILKDISISDNSIVGIGSTVTKSFNQQNVLICGAPAKIVKENIDWKI